MLKRDLIKAQWEMHTSATTVFIAKSAYTRGKEKLDKGPKLSQKAQSVQDFLNDSKPFQCRTKNATKFASLLLGENISYEDDDSNGREIHPDGITREEAFYLRTNMLVTFVRACYPFGVGTTVALNTLNGEDELYAQKTKNVDNAGEEFYPVDIRPASEEEMKIWLTNEYGIIPTIKTKSKSTKISTKKTTRKKSVKKKAA